MGSKGTVLIYLREQDEANIRIEVMRLASIQVSGSLLGP